MMRSSQVKSALGASVVSMLGCLTATAVHAAVPQGCSELGTLFPSLDANTSVKELPSKATSVLQGVAKALGDVALRKEFTDSYQGGPSHLYDWMTAPQEKAPSPLRKQNSDQMAARAKLADCARYGYLAANAHYKAASAAATDEETRAQLDAEFDAVKRDYLVIAEAATNDLPQLSLFVGPSFTIDGSDQFRTGAEISAFYDSGANAILGFARSTTEFRYLTKGSVDTKRDPGSAPPVNVNDVIRSAPGFLRFNTGVSTPLFGSDRVALGFTGGLSTVPGGGGDAPSALRPRAQVSLLDRDFVAGSTYTRLTLGYAYDSYWRNDKPVDKSDLTKGTVAQRSYRRGIVEGLVQIPQLSTGGILASGRLTIDTPINGKGPSEVRLSLLATMNFDDFFKKVVPLN